MQLIGLPASTGATFSGDARVRVNGFNKALDEVLQIAGGADVAMKFSATEIGGASPFSSVTATGLRIEILGSAITGDFSFTKQGEGLLLTATHVELALQDPSEGNGARGPPLIALHEGTGTLNITAAGITGSVAGTVAANLPGVTLGGTFGLTVDASGFSITGTGVSLDIAGQHLAGDFSFERAGTVTRITASNVTLTLSAGATTILALEHGEGDFTISAAGVIGRLAADVKTIGITGLTLASVEIAVDTTQVIDTVRIEARGASLTVLGQTFAADLAFERVADPAGNPVIRVAASHVSLALGGVVSLTDGSGDLLVAQRRPRRPVHRHVRAERPGRQPHGRAVAAAQHDRRRRRPGVPRSTARPASSSCPARATCASRSAAARSTCSARRSPATWRSPRAAPTSASASPTPRSRSAAACSPSAAPAQR